MMNSPGSFIVSTKTKSESHFVTLSSFLRSLPEPTGPKIKTKKQIINMNKKYFVKYYYILIFMS